MNYYIAPSPCGSVRMRSKWLTDNTDATDFIFFTDILILRYTWSWFFPDFFLRPYGAGYTPARNNPHQSDKSAFEKTQRLNEHGLNGLNGFLLILCCHMVLDCIRIVFAPVRRWIYPSKR